MNVSEQTNYILPILILSTVIVSFLLRTQRVQQQRFSSQDNNIEEKIAQIKDFLLKLIQDSLKINGLVLYDFEYSVSEKTLRWTTQANKQLVRTIFTSINAHLFEFLDDTDNEDEGFEIESEDNEEMRVFSIPVVYQNFRFTINIRILTWERIHTYYLCIQEG